MENTPSHVMGITNMGNTCYINSCLQVLLRISELNTLLTTTSSRKCKKKNINESIITSQWDELRQLMMTNEGVIQPDKFIHYLRETTSDDPMYEMFSGIEQNDTQEFLTYMIECIHKCRSREVTYRFEYKKPQTMIDKINLSCLSMKKKAVEKNYSELIDLFYGIQLTKIVSKTNHIHSLRPEMSSWLHLPIVSYDNVPHTHLHECIKSSLQKETLTGDNAWYNEITNKKESVYLIKSYWSLPKVLCINLNRFSLDGTNKLTNEVIFPIDSLDMSEYIECKNMDNYKYELFAVINHVGDLHNGHYTTYIKDRKNKWYHIDDETINKVPRICEIISSLAYCLFYRRKK